MVTKRKRPEGYIQKVTANKVVTYYPNKDLKELLNRIHKRTKMPKNAIVEQALYNFARSYSIQMDDLELKYRGKYYGK